MANFYALFSNEKIDDFGFYLTKQYPKKNLSIGWGKVNPINKTAYEVEQLVAQNYSQTHGNGKNGAVKSLILFAELKLGDVVFVRGAGKISDIVIINNHPFFDSIGHSEDDYFLKCSFTPLSQNYLEIKLSDLDDVDVKNALINDEGKYVAMKSVNEKIALSILKNCIEHLIDYNNV